MGENDSVEIPMHVNKKIRCCMVGGQAMMHMRCFVTRLGIGKGPQCHVVGGSFRMRPHSTGIYKLRGGLEVLEERCVELEVQASEKALCTQIRSVRLYPHPGFGVGFRCLLSVWSLGLHKTVQIGNLLLPFFYLLCPY